MPRYTFKNIHTHVCKYIDTYMCACTFTFKYNDDEKKTN